MRCAQLSSGFARYANPVRVSQQAQPMKRAQRLEMVQNVVADQERRRAEALAGSERRVSENEAKLAELESYHASYVRGFAIRAEAGIDGNMARDYHACLGRLEEAIRQQTQVVIRVRAQRDGE